MTDPTCPTCGGPTRPGRDNPDRPFCCARCRELDLYRWLSEDYRIPGPAAAPEDVLSQRSPERDLDD